VQWLFNFQNWLRELDFFDQSKELTHELK
jgi:hypothetical protein